MDDTNPDDVVTHEETPEEYQLSRRYFLEADALNYTNKSKEAERAYRGCMDATGEYGVFYHLAQGQIYVLHDNLEYALTEFEIASQINDQIDFVHINLGLTYRKMAGRLRSANKTDKASAMMNESLDAHERAVQLNPDNSGAWSTMAMVCMAMGKSRLQDADNCSQKALDLDPKNYSALTTLAKIRQQQGRKEEARTLAVQAIALNPDDPFAYGLFGARRAGETEPFEPKPNNAISWLQKALDRDPGNAFVFTEMGKAYRELQDFQEAFTWFDRAVSVTPEGYGALANRGNAYLRLHQLELAETDLRRALAIRPEYPFALSSLRDLLAERGRHEEALALAEQIVGVSFNPVNKRHAQELSRLFQKDRAESIETTQRLIRSRADTKLRSTERAATRALVLYSRNHHALGILGRCSAARGNYQDAKNYLEQALAINADAYFYRLILGRVFEDLGELEAAEREYRLVVARDGPNNDANEDLRRIKTRMPSAARRRKSSGSDQELVFLNNRTGREERHPIKLIREFLADRIRDWNLPIGEIIDQVGDSPVFIIAKTGVGKTVTVPTKILLSLCDQLTREGRDALKRVPQVFVVEPRIPICTMTMAEMNEGYQSYLAYRLIDYPDVRDYVVSHGVATIESRDHKTVNDVVQRVYEYVDAGKAAYDPRHFNLYGCITSVTGKINADAPIVFVTTGIMESLTFEGSKLDSKYNRIVIDEAHVTIEANPAIELGIALARKQGVKIDYMSATVDPATLAEDLGVKIVYAGTQRFPIYLTNLNATVEEAILGLVGDFLIAPNPTRFPRAEDFSDPKVRDGIRRVRLHLLSQEGFDEDGRRHPGLRERPQGMLVIVNSHQSESSDTYRIADLIARAPFNTPVRRVHTLRLASPVVRDPAQKLAFDRLIRSIEDQNGRYVIVATNVVEMGLTFSSLDYVVTMDSEFDSVFVDGSQMIRKVELGINALYQRIGRVGRIRPGVAFIAKDFGASYSAFDDETLSAGLKEAPIRYPLAKGNFLKLALYSFREKLQENELRARIADLALPSRLHADNDLWCRFLAERNRLRQIGIASGDDLTTVGRAVLDFVGLDDMDFARLLGTVIRDYGSRSDLAVVFTVLAAASEFGFDSLMVRKYILSNTQQLSAMEIIHEDVLGLPAGDAYLLVKQHENDVGKLRIALEQSGIDDQVSSDIVAFVQAGYRVVFNDDGNTERTTPPAAFVKTEAGKYGEEGQVLDSTAEGQDDDLGEDIKRDLAAHSTSHTLAFERAVVSFGDQSEVINIYRLFRHFFNNYFSRMRARALNALETSELRRAMEEEASKIQVSARALSDLNGIFSQLCRHAKVELAREERSLPVDFQLTLDERQALLEGCVRDLLFERKGNDDDFDLSLRLFDMVGPTGRPRDLGAVARQLQGVGFEIGSEQVKELWFLIVREAQVRYRKLLEQFAVSDSREALPPMTKGLEKELLKVLRAIGYHRELTFKRGEFGLAAVVHDQLGAPMEIRLSEENNPLSTALVGRETVKVYAKLTPKMGVREARTDGGEYGFEELEEKGFRLSHVTLMS